MPFRAWGTVERRSRFSASKVGLAEICPLGLLLEQESAYEADIPSNPLAKLGSILHKIVSGLQPGTDFDRVVEEALAQEVMSSVATQTVNVPLRDVVRPSELAARVGVAKRLAASLAVQTKPAPLRRARVTGFPTSGAFAWSNVWLKCGELELQGELDHLERASDDSLTVTEAKTGRIRDKDGQLKSQHIAQLLSYGLLVKANGGGERIKLRLCGLDGDEVIEFSEDYAKSARSMVQRLRSVLPLGTALESSELAKCGDGCRHCTYRSRCASYRTWAPTRWNTPDSEQLPLDCWGVIQGIEDGSEPWLVRIYVRDASGSSASITHVPRRLLPPDLAPGRFVAAFNVRSFERKHAQRPANFAVASLRRVHEGAHDAAIFFE